MMTRSVKENVGLSVSLFTYLFPYIVPRRKNTLTDSKHKRLETSTAIRQTSLFLRRAQVSYFSKRIPVYSRATCLRDWGIVHALMLRFVPLVLVVFRDYTRVRSEIHTKSCKYRVFFLLKNDGHTINTCGNVASKKKKTKKKK